jgi:hypothetical protein
VFLRKALKAVVSSTVCESTEFADEWFRVIAASFEVCGLAFYTQKSRSFFCFSEQTVLTDLALETCANPAALLQAAAIYLLLNGKVRRIFVQPFSFRN